jgi:hypothetical protein
MTPDEARRLKADYGAWADLGKSVVDAAIVQAREFVRHTKSLAPA